VTSAFTERTNVCVISGKISECNSQKKVTQVQPNPRGTGPFPVLSFACVINGMSKKIIKRCVTTKNGTRAPTLVFNFKSPIKEN
jgi:hypothetical protein